MTDRFAYVLLVLGLIRMLALFLATDPLPPSAFLMAFSPFPALSDPTTRPELRVWSADSKRSILELTPANYNKLPGSLSQRSTLKNVLTGLGLLNTRPVGIAIPRRGLLNETLRQGICGPHALWSHGLELSAEILQAGILRAELATRSQDLERPENWSIQVRCNP